jgi:UDP-N-acetylglucosamine--N-acetylmuramyl-(pentapeptide) pyrophosphoryl-undecaprenol N-acetylglucosamine transferase
MTGSTRVLIAGGGTAGHVLPGLAVASVLVGRGLSREEIHFVGAQGRIEAEIVPEAGFDITLLPGRGVQRRMTVQNLRAVLGLLTALFRAVRLVRERRPEVVLALGGFASAACSLAAVLWRVPLVIAEQNARAGASNRLVARFARSCAVPFEETDLPRAVVTGNPVRPEILAVATTRDRISARRDLGVDPDRTLVVVFAGSLGSVRINEATYGVAEAFAGRGDLSILHVVGARDWDDRPAPVTGRLQYLQLRYSDRMDLVLAAADLAVCRAGGTTVAELAVVGVPAVLVPLPIATRDHQTANAAALLRVGAAVLVPDSELDATRLATELSELLLPEVLDRMSAAARSLGRPDASDAVADLVVANLGNPRPGPTPSA